MGRLTVEFEPDAIVGQEISPDGAVERIGMPPQADIHIVEESGFDHEGFARAALFGGTAIITDGALDHTRVKSLLEGKTGGNTRHAQQVVAAAMTRSAVHQRFSIRHTILAQPGQCIELAQYADDRTLPFGVTCNKSRGYLCHTFFEREALELERRDEQPR